MILIDTHVLIWFLSGYKRLSEFHHEQICDALVSKQLLLSAISIWEIAIKERAGRLNLSKPLDILRQELEATICIIPITAEILYNSVYLPGDFHKDPADRIIISTAIFENCQLITYDEKIVQYAAAGHVRCL